MVPPPLAALLFLQGGFDGAGCGGEGCRGPREGWGRGTEGRTPCWLTLPGLCPAPGHPPGTAVPWQPPYKSFCRWYCWHSEAAAFPRQDEPILMRSAIPQSALQLARSTLSRGGGGSRANKNNFPASARAESGSAVSRDLQRALASARRVLLPGGLGISTCCCLPGGCVSVGLASQGDRPQHAAA